MDAVPIGERYAGRVNSTYDIVAEPTRRRILDALRERPRSVGDLVSLTSLSQPGVSKHLRVLPDGGLVRVRPNAQQRWYELHPWPLTEFDAALVLSWQEWRCMIRPRGRDGVRPRRLRTAWEGVTSG